MRILNETLPEASSAHSAYKEIKQHLSQLKGSIAHYQVGSDFEEIGKFGHSVQVSAVKSLMINYLLQSKEQEAYDLLVSHIKKQKLLPKENLNECEYGMDHPSTQVLIRQALTSVIRNPDYAYLRDQYQIIKGSYDALFPLK